MAGESQGFLHGGRRAAAGGDRGLIKDGTDETGHADQIRVSVIFKPPLVPISWLF
jgi:hypothetical protein